MAKRVTDPVPAESTKMGRPTAFCQGIVDQILALALDGHTDAAIAAKVGISLTTFKNWKAAYPDFLAALKESKATVDDLVENALLRRALGYQHPAVKIHFDKFGKVGMARYTEHYPPDTTACIIWLKNRRPQAWRDVQGHEVVVPPNPATLPAKTFEQFCEAAGYPQPFPKQVEMKDFVVGGEDPRMLLGARGIGKSEYTTILGLAYAIYSDPNDTTIISTKVEKNGRRMLKAMARALEQNGVQLTINNADEIRVAGCTSKEHNAMLVPVGSAGFRSMHPRRVVFDDPVVPGKVSEADRDELKVTYEEAIKLTKNVAIIGQPVDFRDLYAYLRGIIKTMEVPFGAIPELDHDLDAQRAAGVDEKSIQASYFLKVTPEGDASFHDIQRIPEFPTSEPAYAFIDPADGGDYTAIGAFNAHFQGMAIVGRAFKKAWHVCIPEIREFCIKYNVKKLGFEVNMFGTQPLQTLREALGDLGISVEGKYTHSNKEARIALASAHSKNLYLSKQSDPEYARQVIEYGHDAKFDDAPDTIATFLEWAGMIRPPKAAKKPAGDL